MSWEDPPDWETMEAIEPSAGDELERMMARYARVRLEPSPARAKRARAALMEAAWRSKIEADGVSRRWRLPFASWSARRVAVAAVAAVFAGLMVGSSVFAASRAGGPLYDTRIALENAMLPSDPAARLQAEIAAAQTRLAEAYDAEARGDQGALNAALHAYSQEAGTLAAATGPAASQALAAMEQHRAVLLSLVARAPSAAQPGLDRALSSSDQAIERLTIANETQNGNGNGATNGGNGNGVPGNGNGNGATNGGNGNGNSSAATPGPAAAPASTSQPGHTPKPAHTPNPASSSAPGNAPAPSSPSQP